MDICESWHKRINTIPFNSSILYQCRIMNNHCVGDIMSCGRLVAQEIRWWFCPLQQEDEHGDVVGVLWCRVLSFSILILFLCIFDSNTFYSTDFCPCKPTTMNVHSPYLQLHPLLCTALLLKLDSSAILNCRAMPHQKLTLQK